VIYLAAYGGLCFIRAARLQALYLPVLILLFIFSAFRFEVGCDWTGYLLQYQLQQSLGWDGILEQREPLWWAVIQLTHWAELPYPWLNVWSSALFFAGVHLLARRQPDPLGFIVLLYPVLILNMPMSGIRQAAAIGIICLAFIAFVERRPLGFTVWIVVAAGFHASAMVFILLAPLAGGEYTKGRVILALLLALPGAWLLASGGDAEVAISRYVNTGINAFGAAYRTGIIFLSGLFFIIWLRRPWSLVFPQDYRLPSLGAPMMMAVFPFVAVSSVIADRLGYYFLPLQAMIFARIPYLWRGGATPILASAPYIGLGLVLGVWTMTSPIFSLCYLPYKTWLFGYPEAVKII